MAQPFNLRTVALADQGRLGAAVWHVAGPVMLTQVLYTAMSVVDMFWVGRLGHVAVAAVALSGSVLGVCFALGQVFSAAGLALAARAAGEGDSEGVSESFKHSLLLAVLFGLVVAVPGVILARPILRLFGSAPDVVAAGHSYLGVVLGTMPVFFAGMVAYSLFQALGDTRTPMFIVIGSNVLNLVLDPILIFGWLGAPRLGAAGAALATSVSYCGALLAMMAVLWFQGRARFRAGIRVRTLRAVLDIGVPAGLQSVTRPSTGMMMFGIVTRFGTEATAAFGIGLRTLQVMYVYMGGLEAAGEALVGQSLGRQRPELALRVSQKVTVTASVVQAVVMPIVFGFAPILIRVFNQSPEVVRFGTEYLRVLAPALLLHGLSTGWASAQRGAGSTRPPMLAALVSNWGVKLPAAWILARLVGPVGVWVGIALSIAVEDSMLWLAYRRRGWLRKELAWK